MPTVTAPPAAARRRTRAFPVRGWSMQPLAGILLLKVRVAAPTPEEHGASRSVLLALDEAQVRELADQLTSELAMLRKERPAGNA